VAVATATPRELQYGCDLTLLPSELRDRFIQLEQDEAARVFLDASRAAPHGAWRSRAYGVLRSLMSDYDAYGLLDMYPMHLLSAPQLDRLLGEGRRARLLDIGAGSGGVTQHAAELFQHVSATETSGMLKRSLRRRGFTVLDCDLTYAPLPSSTQRFDAVLCFNVIDRCSHPLTLVRHARAALEANGTMIVSVPLPLKPHVHVGRFTVDQEERLPTAQPSWEGGAASIARELLTPAGLELRSLSRVPYLCRGDATTPLYVLDAAVFVCSSRRTP